GSRSARIGKHLPQRGAAAAEPRHAVTLVGPFSGLEARIVRLGTGPRSQCEGRSSVGLARELNANAQRARRARAERGVEMAFGRSGKPVQIDAGFVLLHELEEHGNGSFRFPYPMIPCASCSRNMGLTSLCVSSPQVRWWPIGSRWTSVARGCGATPAWIRPTEA